MVLKSNKYYALILTTTILYSYPNILYAENFIWTGNNNINWSNSNNWNPDGPPTALDSVLIDRNGENTATIDED